MKSLLTLAAVLSTALTGVFATSTPNEDLRMVLIKERQSSKFATNGINPTSPSGIIFTRCQDVGHLANDTRPGYATYRIPYSSQQPRFMESLPSRTAAIPADRPESARFILPDCWFVHSS